MSFRQSIPAFLGGISQQSRAIRSTNLVDDCANIEHLPSEGATKRYPTEHVEALSEQGGGDYIDPLSQSQTHAVPLSRDEGDFIAVFDGSLADGDYSVRVYDSSGAAQTLIEADDAFGYIRGASHSDLAFQQVADTLYVVNKTTEVVAAPGTDYASWRTASDAGVFVKQTDYDRTYVISTPLGDVSVDTQDDSANYASRVYSGTPGGTNVQPYRITAAQAAGTDPILMDSIADGGELQYDVRANETADLNLKHLDSAFVRYDGTPTDNGATVVLSMTSEPAAGNAAAAGFSIDSSNGVPFTDVNVARFDRDFLAVWLEPGQTVLAAGEWVCFANRGAEPDQTRLSPTYVARQLAKGLVDLGATVEPVEAYTPSLEDSESSSFYMNTGAAAPVSAYAATVGEGVGTPAEDTDSLLLWTDDVEEITDLPVFFKQGAVVEITGSLSSEEDNYFVQFVTDEWREAGSDEETIETFPADLWGRGGWRETAAPGLPTGGYDATTMPHRLERAADGTWTFRSVGWGKRPSGDNLTNPEPSFVGGRIFDVFYHEDRLGFLSGSSLILSESGEIENFWRTTVLALPDSDPIDITLSAMQGSALYHAVSFDRALHVFSEDSQAVLSSEGALSPVTVSAKITGTYRTSPTVPPTTQESSLFAAYRTGNFMQVREMMPGQYAGDLISGEVTLAVPRLLPSSVRKVLTGGGGSDLVYLTDDGQVFLYQYLRAGRENIMAAWGRWDFPDGDLVDAVRMGDHIYALINRVGLSATYTCLEKIEVGAGRGDTTEDYKIRSDRLTSRASGTYDRASDTTTFTVGFPLVSGASLQVTADNGGDLEYGSPLTIETYSPVNDAVTVYGDFSDQPVLIGISYDATITMSHPVVQAPSQRGGVTSVVGGNTLVRDVVVSLADTGYLKATVEAVGQSPATEEFLGDRMDVGELNSSALSSREFLVPIHASSDEFRVTFSNDTALPSTLVNGAWALRFNSRYRQS